MCGMIVLRHSLDLNRSTVRRVALVYSRMPVPFWHWRPVRVRTVVYDDPYWVEMRHGTARAVRRAGWPLHDMTEPAADVPTWAEDLRRREVLQIYVTDEAPAEPRGPGETLPVWLAAIICLSLPYRFQAIAIAAMAAAVTSLNWAQFAPRDVRQAKAAIGVKDFTLLSAYQLWRHVESVKRDGSASP